MMVRQFAAQRQRPNERMIGRLSLEALCADSRTAGRVPACRTYNLFSTVVASSAVLGGLGFVFLGGVALAGYLGQSKRRRLVLVFRPTLYASAAGIAILAIGHSVLLLAATYLLGEAIERWPSWILLVVATGAVVLGVAIVAAAFSVPRRAGATVLGRTVELPAHARLAEAVRLVAAAAGATAPRHVVVGMGASLFATEARVACMDGPLKGRTLSIPLPLARILTEEEFRALLAHEFGHFAGDEGRFAVAVVPYYAGAVRAMATLRFRNRGIRRAALEPAIILWSFFFDSFGEAVRVAQDREAAADRVASGVAGDRVFASALVKAHAFEPAWQVTLAAMRGAVAGGTRFVNASELFAEIADTNSGPDRLRGLAATSLAHPTDHHQNLGSRLAALRLDLRDVAFEALAAAPAVPAVALIDGYEALEQDLTEAGHVLIANHEGE
jgi:Zn-dependent protease with chaperone function